MIGSREVSFSGKQCRLAPRSMNFNQSSTYLESRAPYLLAKSMGTKNMFTKELNIFLRLFHDSYQW